MNIAQQHVHTAANYLYRNGIIERRGTPSTGIKKTKLEYRL